MIASFLLLSVLLAAPLAAPQQVRDIDNGNSLDHLCGKLVRSMPHPVKGRYRLGSVQQSALSKVTMRLFPRQAETICCTNLSPVAKTTTDDTGEFEFKNAKSSFYWLVAHVDGHDYKMAIQYHAADSPKDRCSDLTYEIEDAGLFELGRIIPSNP